MILNIIGWSIVIAMVLYLCYQIKQKLESEVE